MTFAQLLESSLVSTIKELIFEEWLAEDLSGVELRRDKDHYENNKNQHVWSLHHPQHGELATVKLTSNTKHPIHKTPSASMCIRTHYNHKAQEAGDTDKSTTMGPHYKVGSSATRRMLHHLSKHYPN